MRTWIGNRFALSHIASAAAAETKFAARVLPDVLRFVAPIVIWALIAITLGAIVGVAAVALPPLGAFGIDAAVGVLLLWVMPEERLVFPGLIRKAFLLMLVIFLCVPYYYMVQLGDLPWISIRRVAALALIIPFLLAVSSSAEVRRRIAERLRPSTLIFICAVGYLVMAILSLPSSALLGDSMSALVSALMEWYIPFFAAIYILRDKNDIVLMLKIICFCALLITMVGRVEVHLQHRFLVDVFPRSMLAELAERNPMLGTLVDGLGAYRNGVFRAASTFLVPLS